MMRSVSLSVSVSWHLQQRLQSMATCGAWQQCLRGLSSSRAASVSPKAIGECLSEFSVHRRASLCSRELRTSSVAVDYVHSVISPCLKTELSPFGRVVFWKRREEDFRAGAGVSRKAMKFSTLSVDEESSGEALVAESGAVVEEKVTIVEGSGGEAVVTGIETEVVVEEFVPGNESVPSTPLVEAIESQKVEEVVEEKRVSRANLTGSLDEFFASLPPPPDRTASLLAQNSDREIQPGRLYIGGLPFSVKGAELVSGLREMCSKHGTVKDVALAQHRHQSQLSIDEGKHRGFAFVTMGNADEAEEVVENLNGVSAWGRVIMVSYGLRRVEPKMVDQIRLRGTPVQRCKVFVGNLNESTSRSDLANRFQEFGTIVDVKVITELHSSRSRGFGFVTFAQEDQAMKAILDLDGSILDGSAIRVNIAKYPQSF